MKIFGAASGGTSAGTSGGTSAGTSGGTSAGTSGGTYDGIGPGAGTALPAAVQLHHDDDTQAFDAFHPSTFDQRNLHPDYWALAQLPFVLAEVPVDGSVFAHAIAPYWDKTEMKATLPSEDFTSLVPISAVEDLTWALSDRQVTMGDYGAEIHDQAGSFHHYYYNVLSIQSTTHPATCRLISLGMVIASVIGMHWKLEIMRPRPVQVWPGILPIIPTPPHPSYPSNHSTQAHLISTLLLDSLLSDRQCGIGKYLSNLAERIAVNRERAGVHFASDTWAGIALAEAISKELSGLDLFKELSARCRHELPHLVGDKSPTADADDA